MEWKTKSKEDSIISLAQWRRWFAWHPVFLWTEKSIIWLEMVERRTKWSYTSMDEFYREKWEYRKIRGKNNEL